MSCKVCEKCHCGAFTKMKLTAEDCYYISGKGRVYTMNVTEEESRLLRSGVKVELTYEDKTEEVEVIGVERFSTRYSPVGLLVRKI